MNPSSETRSSVLFLGLFLILPLVTAPSTPRSRTRAMAPHTDPGSFTAPLPLRRPHSPTDSPTPHAPRHPPPRHQTHTATNTLNSPKTSGTHATQHPLDTVDTASSSSTHPNPYTTPTFSGPTGVVGRWMTSTTPTSSTRFDSLNTYGWSTGTVSAPTRQLLYAPSVKFDLERDQPVGDGSTGFGCQPPGGGRHPFISSRLVSTSNQTPRHLAVTINSLAQSGRMPHFGVTSSPRRVDAGVPPLASSRRSGASVRPLVRLSHGDDFVPMDFSRQRLYQSLTSVV
jgi:hypothetical protein